MNTPDDQTPDDSIKLPRDGNDTASGQAPLALGGAQKQEALKPGWRVGMQHLRGAEVSSFHGDFDSAIESISYGMRLGITCITIRREESPAGMAGAECEAVESRSPRASAGGSADPGLTRERKENA